MNSKKLVSFDIRADFGFLKKPDYNDGLLLSYNMLHKPALLGILGAIVGLKGYTQKKIKPEYLELFESIPVGIAPLDGFHKDGNFKKSTLKYTNTVGYANQDGNLIIEESILIRPAYRCFLLLDLANEHQQKLYEYLKKGYAEYIPYLGKNEYQAWIEDEIKEYSFKEFVPQESFRIASLFIKKGMLHDKMEEEEISFDFTHLIPGTFCYFERLPIGFHEKLNQYELGEFVFTDWLLKKENKIMNLYQLSDNEKLSVIQLN